MLAGNIDLLSVSEVLMAKVLHDMAGVVGAVVSCCEILELDGKINDVVMLKNSVEDLVSRFKLVRQSYTSSLDNTDFSDTKTNIQKYLNSKTIDSPHIIIWFLKMFNNHTTTHSLK